MILLLRGHIRDGFDDARLFFFVHNLSSKYDLKIYIHTWNIIQSNVSWRPMPINNKIVTNDLIYNYFGEVKHLIKQIIIEDDAKIDIIGNKTGRVCSSVCPLVGWKNMWYGKYQLINHIKSIIEDPNEIILNTRFDMHRCPFSHLNNNILPTIEQSINKKITKNIFASNDEVKGIDNFYLGNFNTMYTLIEHFYKNLDDILEKQYYKHLTNQEFLVFRENNHLFDKK